MKIHGLEVLTDPNCPERMVMVIPERKPDETNEEFLKRIWLIKDVSR